MKASEVYRNAIAGDLTQTSSKCKVLAESDMNKYGVFCLEFVSFNTFKSKIERKYVVEAWQYDSEGNLEEIKSSGWIRTKREALVAYKNFTF